MTSLCCDVLKALRGKTLVTAESITGGGIGAALTAVSGSSAVYKGGIISYCDDIKHRISQLDAKKKELQSDIIKIEQNNHCNIGIISNYMDKWEQLLLSDKITVVDALIERIDATKDSLDIKWKI